MSLITAPCGAGIILFAISERPMATPACGTRQKPRFPCTVFGNLPIFAPIPAPKALPITLAIT